MRSLKAPMKVSSAIRSSAGYALTLIVLIFSLVSLPPQAHSQTNVTLRDVKISGNLRVEDDGIRLHL